MAAATGDASWWASAELEDVWARIGDRLERNGIRAEGRLQLTGLERSQRHAVGNLVGRSVTTSRITVDLAELDERMRLRAGIGIAAATETVLGRSLVNRRERAARHAERRAAPMDGAQAWVRAHPDIDWPWIQEWLVGMRSDGLLGRASDPAALVTTALDVLHHRRAHLTSPDGAAGAAAGGGAASGVPAGATPIARSALAAAVCHDAHALDDDRRLASAVLRAVAVATGSPVPGDARDRRDLWDRLGVVTDLVSSTCLVWRLPARLWGADGRPRGLDSEHPTHVTWWDVRSGIQVEPGGRVLVCENPAVLEAVATAELDVSVVCTSGRANLVTGHVLAQVAQSKATIMYHGDFDWSGLAMASDALRRYGAKPWLMSAADYENVPGSLPLSGPPGESSWDPELAAAMRRRGVAVHEEAVLDQLIDALE